MVPKDTEMTAQIAFAVLALALVSFAARKAVVARVSESERSSRRERSSRF